MNRIELKERAKAQLKGHWCPLLFMVLLYHIFVPAKHFTFTFNYGTNRIQLPAFFGGYKFSFNGINSVFDFFPPEFIGLFSAMIGFFAMMAVFFVIIRLLIYGPFHFGKDNFLTTFVRTGETSFDKFFDGFKNFGANFILGLLETVFIFLWSLLLIIPGIIMSYAYSAAYFIKVARPNMDAMDCIRTSKEIMRGHKWELFVIDLSFIGWGLLCLLTFGIGFLWLNPYVEVTRANYFVLLLRENEIGIGEEVTEEQPKFEKAFIDDEESGS